MAKKNFALRSLFCGCLPRVEDVPSTRPSPSRKNKKQGARQSSCTRLSYSDVSSQMLAADLSSSLAGSSLCTFTMAELKVATGNFSGCNLIGEGGFGPVYKGLVDEKIKPNVKPQAVAVKLLDLEGFQGHKQWLTEVLMLGQLRNPHIVKLIGYCYEDDHRLLVYEFMSNRSLEQHLFNRFYATLPWKTRIQIAVGAAKGLRFLHGADPPVIYRDFKASNVLLDSEYRAKLSDFGLARDGPQGDDTHVSSQVMGTEGYAAPEYIMTGHLTAKSDVYSFGVVLLELLTGRLAVDKTRPTREQNLVDWARSSLNDPRRLDLIMDPALEGQYSAKGAQRAAALAYMCLSHLPKHRPNMKAVVDVLEPLQDPDDVPLGTFVFTAVEENADVKAEDSAARTGKEQKDDTARQENAGMTADVKSDGGAARERKEQKDGKARQESSRVTGSEDGAARRTPPRRRLQQDGDKHWIPSSTSANYTDTALYRRSPRRQRGRGA